MQTVYGARVKVNGNMVSLKDAVELVRKLGKVRVGTYNDAVNLVETAALHNLNLEYFRRNHHYQVIQLPR